MTPQRNNWRQPFKGWLQQQQHHWLPAHLRQHQPTSHRKKGHALDLSTQTGTSLFQNGCAPLSSKFMGKVDNLHLFLADMCNCTQTCRWNATGHTILTIIDGLHVFNVIEDYGKIPTDQVEAACITCNTHGADLKACQNAQMMYECFINSITDEARATLAMHELDFHEDGPALFYHIINQLFTATFSNTQASRDKLSEFHPKQSKYNILQVNNYICTAIKTLCTASTTGGMITQ